MQIRRNHLFHFRGSFLGRILTIFFVITALRSYGQQGESIYTERPDDPEAVYFTPEHFAIKADGSVDVSAALQKAINRVASEKNFGIVFIPEGKYKISRTIYVPKAVRLIGYGKKRPEIFLADNTPGYQHQVANDKAGANYMFWFVSGMVKDTADIHDAGAGTFYSALSNINLRIGTGNPYAIALRTHYAQHSFIEHVDVHTGEGMAGMFDVGNEMEDVRFYGGDYGIYTTKTSDGWQFMMVNTYFEGQRKAAIRTRGVGLTMVHLQAKNVPAVVEIEPDYNERLYMEDSRLEHVKHAAVIVSHGDDATTQINLIQVTCNDVPTLIDYRGDKPDKKVSHATYRIDSLCIGLQMSDLAADPLQEEHYKITPLSALPEASPSVIPGLPPMKQWVNIKTLGAKGDGKTDDTQIFQEAMDKYPVIYVPQGWYVISHTLKMNPNTVLIGLHPWGTQLMLKESTPYFSGFGGPRALLESSRGGNNILTGIGLNTGGYNYRAVACKWMAGKDSYVNDVKFVGGHGSIPRGGTSTHWTPPPRRISSPEHPVNETGKDQAWDNQYWSLWITDNGGGTFKDIWSASTYATSGLYISNTTTPGRIYGMSLEHHVRNEAIFRKVSHWKIYALQLEEESRESADVVPIDLSDCSDMSFANLYMFRVIRMTTPSPYSIRSWHNKRITFLGVHNYSQIKYTTTVPLYDVNTHRQVRPWEFAKLTITGEEKPLKVLADNPDGVRMLGTGFEFAEGLTSDPEGNVYFCEQRMRRIYKWSASDQELSLLATFPWQPLSLGFDTKGHLLVIFRYDPQPGYLVDGKQESVPVLPDAKGTSFSGWGNSGFATWVYSIDPNNPEETIHLLPRIPFSDMKAIHKLLMPAHRWRDSHDFNKVSLFVPAHAFVAPDQVTYIPEYYDLTRAVDVVPAFPGHPYFSADEYSKRMVKIDIDAQGKPSNLRYFVEKGEFGSAVDTQKDLYVADGQIYEYDPQGKQIGMIHVPERPTTIRFGGSDHQTLFVTSRSSLFAIPVHKNR